MPLNLYPPIIFEQDASLSRGFGGDIDEDCELLQEACKGFGADKDQVIAVLGTKDSTERFKLSHRFKELYGKPLADLMKSEFSGDFEDLTRMLAMPLDEAECHMIKKATKGVGCHKTLLYSILIGRSNDEMNRIKTNYYKYHTQDLGKMLASELSGDMEVLIFNSIQAGEEIYDPGYHTDEKAKEDAELIYDKGQGQWGTNEKKIFKVLCASPPKHIMNIDKIYAETYGFSLWKAMEKELSGDVGEAARYLVAMKTKPYVAMASLIKAACHGIGTDELLLTCCIVRYQHVMKEVMSAHIEEYSKTIQDRVKGEVRGNYKDLLFTMLNTAWPEEA